MKEIVIIGAGPAGLTAAYELLKQAPEQYRVTILEETGEIGGISRTVKHNGNRMDIGGHRFFSKDARVRAWWDSVMPTQGSPSFDDIQLNRQKQLKPGGPDPEQTDQVMLIRNRVSRIYYRHKFFDYPITMKLQTFKNMGLPATVKAGFSYLKSCVAKKPEDSLENFYINRFGRTLYGMFFEGYTEKLWGRHPREISADWGSQRVKGLSVAAVIRDVFSKLLPGKHKVKETSLIEEFYYPKFGPGHLWETVAENIEQMGGKIVKNCAVKSVRTENGRVCSLTAVKDGEEEKITGDIFISSMPVKDLVGGMNDVPPEIAEYSAGLPYRDFVTVGLLVDKLNLKNQTDIPTLGNIVPDCWIYVQDTQVKLGRIQIFNNWSPYMVTDPAHKVWIGLEYFCAEGDSFWNMSQEECVSYAVSELIKMGIISGPECVHDSHRERVKKAYPAYFDTYSHMDEIIAYLNGFENLYCVGRNGQHRYNNMDHSMVTAFETVDNIVGNIPTRDNIWNVNTEKEYHEEEKGSK